LYLFQTMIEVHVVEIATAMESHQIVSTAIVTGMEFRIARTDVRTTLIVASHMRAGWQSNRALAHGRLVAVRVG
jgi:hypothetical protein